MDRRTVTAAKALFMKLGENGMWERDCTTNGTLRLDYREIPHEKCINHDWSVARAFPPQADPGSVTRHLNQIQQFYEEPADTLWITFYSDRLWWCFAKGGVSPLPDGSRIRYALDGWSDKDVHGNLLLKSNLSGKLLAVQMFQGTICLVREREYLLHRINGTSEPHVAAAQDALDNLVSALIPIIRNLQPKELETLTDLIFSRAGWQRTGVAGEIEKDIDLDLISPITQERFAVQVKSKATESIYRSYQAKFSDMRGFSRFYFVTHSPDAGLTHIAEESNDGAFVFWGVEQLALHAARNGMVGWLLDKAS